MGLWWKRLECLLEGTCVSSNAGNIVSVTFLAVGTEETFYHGSFKQVWFFFLLPSPLTVSQLSSGVKHTLLD